MHLWHNELRPQRPTTKRLHTGRRRWGRKIPNRRGRYVFHVLGPLSAWKTENDEPLEPLEHRGYPVHRHWHRPGNRRRTVTNLAIHVHAPCNPFDRCLEEGEPSRAFRWLLRKEEMPSNVLNYRRYSERLFIKEWDASSFRSHCYNWVEFWKKGHSVALLSIILSS